MMSLFEHSTTQIAKRTEGTRVGTRDKSPHMIKTKDYHSSFFAPDHSGAIHINNVTRFCVVQTPVSGDFSSTN